MKINKFDLIKTEVVRDLITAKYAYGIEGEEDEYDGLVHAAVAAANFNELLGVLDTTVDLRVGQLLGLTESRLVSRKVAKRAEARVRRWARRFRELSR